MPKPKVVAEPPSGNRFAKVNWDDMCRTARDNPGQWVETPVPLSPSVAGAIKRREYRSVDPGEFEVTTRKVPGEDNLAYLYLRHRG